MSHSFSPCSACARHVRSTDARCPFCGGSRVVAQPLGRIPRMSRAAWLAVALVGCSQSTAEPATYACGDKACLSGVEACISQGCYDILFTCDPIDQWKKDFHGQDLSTCERFSATGGVLSQVSSEDNLPASCVDEDGGVELHYACSQGCYGCPPARLERISARRRTRRSSVASRSRRTSPRSRPRTSGSRPSASPSSWA